MTKLIGIGCEMYPVRLRRSSGIALGNLNESCLGLKSFIVSTEYMLGVCMLTCVLAQYESALIKLSNAGIQIEDLKMQLDDALGAEEMLVSLTERNLMLGEVMLYLMYGDSANFNETQKIEEMRITIEDLEALKELNDELEENHVETEKALQEDIGATSPCTSEPLLLIFSLETKDGLIREISRKYEVLEENSQDLENTISQFRDLVIQLQGYVHLHFVASLMLTCDSELEALRAQTQTAQSESATAASQSAAMMSLNMRLQSSASKNLARSIELEIRKIEARECKDLLGIVQVC